VVTASKLGGLGAMTSGVSSREESSDPSLVVGYRHHDRCAKAV